MLAFFGFPKYKKNQNNNNNNKKNPKKHHPEHYWWHVSSFRTDEGGGGCYSLPNWRRASVPDVEKKRPRMAMYKWIVKQGLDECFQSISGASFVSRSICQQPYWFSNMAEIGWELEHCKSGYKSRRLRHGGVRTTSKALSETKVKR